MSLMNQEMGAGEPCVPGGLVSLVWARYEPGEPGEMGEPGEPGERGEPGVPRTLSR